MVKECNFFRRVQIRSSFGGLFLKRVALLDPAKRKGMVIFIFSLASCGNYAILFGNWVIKVMQSIYFAELRHKIFTKSCSKCDYFRCRHISRQRVSVHDHTSSYPTFSFDNIYTTPRKCHDEVKSCRITNNVHMFFHYIFIRIITKNTNWWFTSLLIMKTTRI